MSIGSGHRPLSRAALLIAALVAFTLLCLPMASGTASAAAFESGQIIVSPEDTSLPVSTPKFDLGSREVTLKEILEKAAAEGSLDLATYPKVTIGGKSYTRDQVEAVAGAPKVVFQDGTTAIHFPGGGIQEHGPDQEGLQALTPKITVPRNAVNFKVTLSPKSRTVKSGTKVQFRATVTGTKGKLSYRWSFGDDSADKTTSGPTVSHTFRGNDKEFLVTLTVTESGNIRTGTASSVIKIGKAKKERKKPKEDKPKKDKAGTPGNNSGDGSPGDYGDDYGYDGYGGDPYGGDYGGAGDPSPAVPSTPKPKKKKPPVTVDDGLVPVRGELLDPDIPAQVIDPTTQQPQGSSNPDQQQAAEPKGFALSGGAKTAIGIAVLLGIGGLTELRSFGRFR